MQIIRDTLKRIYLIHSNISLENLSVLILECKLNTYLLLSAFINKYFISSYEKEPVLVHRLNFCSVTNEKLN